MKPKKCDDLEVHPPHVWEEGWRKLQCPGLKHRSKLRGVPLAERLSRGSATDAGGSGNG